MPSSVWDREVQDAIRQARQRKTKRVAVNRTRRTIPAPFPSPADWRDIVIYFVMVDRFHNPNAPPANLPYDAPFGEFQGGTLKGIREKLPYLQSLGAGALWLTPVFKNPQYLSEPYHGYGIQDFLRVDPRFGSEKDLKALVDEAHARGLYVILDIVLNHTGDIFEYEGHGSEALYRDTPYTIHWRKADGTGNPAWRILPEDLQPGDPGLVPDALVWPIDLQDNRFFRRKGRSEKEKSGELTGDFASLKELVTDFSDVTPERGLYHPVRDILIKAHQYAIARFDVDGFRIDTLKHVERDFARIFGNSIREFAMSIGKTNFFTFGEVADSDEKVAEYTGRFASDPDDLVGVDAALDFPLFYRLPGVLKGFKDNSPLSIATLFEERKAIHRGETGREPKVLLSSHGEASRYFVTFLDNHDQHARFRYTDPADPHRYDAQLSLGVGSLFGLQGIPCLYYGTEQGLCGRGNSDQDVREALWGKPDAFDEAHPFYRFIQALTALRREHPDLRYGRQYFREISGNGMNFGFSPYGPGVLAFARILNDAEILVVANTQTESSFEGLTVVDFALNPPGTSWEILLSNHGTAGSSQVMEKPVGMVTIHQIDGGISHGPLRVIPVWLGPMEIQFLGRSEG